MKFSQPVFSMKFKGVSLENLYVDKKGVQRMTPKGVKKSYPLWPHKLYSLYPVSYTHLTLPTNREV